MIITKDLCGPHGSARYIVSDDEGHELTMYQDLEASAISALLSRKVNPRVVLRDLFAPDVPAFLKEA